MTQANPADTLGTALRAKGLTLACAESCTGGLAAAAISGVPGSSDYFLGGIVAYSNSAKIRLLSVPEATIREKGPVSEETALAMAVGAAAALEADCAFAVTGIAGPGGGSDRIPVGTVWFGFFVAARASAERVVFTGDRSAVREAASAHALRRMAGLLGFAAGS